MVETHSHQSPPRVLPYAVSLYSTLLPPELRLFLWITEEPWPLSFILFAFLRIKQGRWSFSFFSVDGFSATKAMTEKWWMPYHWANERKCGSRAWERTLTGDGQLRWVRVRKAQAQILCWLYEFRGYILDDLLIHTTLIVECYSVVARPGETASNGSHTCSGIGELVQEKKYYRKIFCILRSGQDDLPSLTVWIRSPDSHMAQVESLRAIPWYSHRCYGLWYADVNKWKWNKL